MMQQRHASALVLAMALGGCSGAAPDEMGGERQEAPGRGSPLRGAAWGPPAGAPVPWRSGACIAGAPCVGDYGFSRSFPDGMAQDVAVDARGDTLIAGTFLSSIDFGPQQVVNPTGNLAVFAARLDLDGAPIWSRGFAGSNDAAAFHVAAVGDGDVAIAGDLQGTLDFGGGPLSSAGEGDVFVARLGAAGEHLHSARFGGPGPDEVGGVAAAEGGALVLAGSFSGDIDFGGGPLPIHGEDPELNADLFVVKLGAAGEHLWSRSFGGPSFDEATAVAVGPEGEIALTGTIAGVVEFGGDAPAPSEAGSDVFVAVLDASGAPVWAARSSGQGTTAAHAEAIAMDGAGRVWIAGVYGGGALDLGPGPMPAPVGGAHAFFLAHYDAGGACLSSKSFPGGRFHGARALAIDPLGHVLLAGNFEGATDFGGGPLTAAGPLEDALFAAKFDGAGALLWSKAWQGAVAGGGALSRGGRALLAGGLESAVDFGGGAEEAPGIFVLGLTP